jgi:hypothetical protein
MAKKWQKIFGAIIKHQFELLGKKNYHKESAVIS